MVSYKIEEVKNFMAALLKGGAFDGFFLMEAELRTYFTLKIGGKRWREWYGEEAPPMPEYLEWKEVKALVYERIRGNRPPLSLKLVLRLGEEEKMQWLGGVKASFPQEGLEGLFVNIYYDGAGASLTTGVSLSAFYPDRSLEREWDAEVGRILEKEGINSEMT